MISENWLILADLGAAALMVVGFRVVMAPFIEGITKRLDVFDQRQTEVAKDVGTIRRDVDRLEGRMFDLYKGANDHGPIES